MDVTCIARDPPFLLIVDGGEHERTIYKRLNSSTRIETMGTDTKKHLLIPASIVKDYCRKSPSELLFFHKFFNNNAGIV